MFEMFLVDTLIMFGGIIKLFLKTGFIIRAKIIEIEIGKWTGIEIQ